MDKHETLLRGVWDYLCTAVYKKLMNAALENVRKIVPFLINDKKFYILFHYLEEMSALFVLWIPV